METFDDEEFGTVQVRPDSRARRLIFRVKEGVRQQLSRGVCRLMYRQAQEVLPRRLAEVARRVGASPREVTIGRGRRKLGHCTRSKSIQLSYCLMFLPEPLVDYVICHELAHLQQMNHGSKFHELCNRYCGGEELALRKQLRTFTFFVLINKIIYCKKCLNYRHEIFYFEGCSAGGVVYYIILYYLCGDRNGRGGNDVPSFFSLQQPL